MAKKQISLPDPNSIVLIDGSSFLYRAYYSLPPMHTPTGQPVSVVYGFCRMLKKLFNELNPQYCAIVWDPGPEKPTVRHTLYNSYKAQRQAAPNDLHNQRTLVKEFATTINLQQVERPGIEADDILYSLSQEFIKGGQSVLFVTSDKDMRQALSDKIFIYDPFQESILDVSRVETKYGIPINKLVFYFALLGDTSDNIPGVKGIGAKTAQELVCAFDSLEDLYTNIAKVPKERTRQLLEAGRESAFLSYQLFLLYYYKLDATPQSYMFDKNQWYQARALFEQLHFTSLLKDFPKQNEGTEESKLVPVTSVAQLHAVTTIDELKELCKTIEEQGFCALDTETNSLRPLESELVGISLCTCVGTAYYIPIAHKTDVPQLDKKIVHALLGPLLANPAIKKYLHHANFDELVLKHHGFDLQGVAFDTLIAAHLVGKEGQRTNLKFLSEFYLGQKMLTFQDVVTKNHLKDFSQVPIDLAVNYAAADAHQTLALVPILQEKLKEQGQEELFKSIELPLIKVLVNMQEEGMPIDENRLQSLTSYAQSALESIQKDIHTMLPPGWQELNLNSPRQLEELLFTVLCLKPIKKTTNKTGYSTDHDVLTQLAKDHPIPALILKYRELFKIKSTYLEGLKATINPHTHRIHTSFSQTSTATGRLASSEPNLQNVPTGTATGSITVRSAFKAPEERAFLSADYSQIELRVLAHVSHDERLMESFLKKQDIHTLTAAGLFEISPEEVKPEQRALAKRINFSILYGLSAFSLSKDLDISYKNAEKYIERYFDQYPGVVKWMEKVIEEATKNGYVRTLWGRVRAVPGIHEKNRIAYDLAKRIAINTVIQGSQAELMKLGMLALTQALKEKDMRARLLIQIHDELLLIAPLEELSSLEKLVKEVLENIVDWQVPLVVTTRTGQDWQQVTK